MYYPGRGGSNLHFFRLVKNLLFGLSPADRCCGNCRFANREILQQRLTAEHPLFRHHVERGNWNPRGRTPDELTWCTQRDFATVVDAVSCEEWDE